MTANNPAYRAINPATGTVISEHPFSTDSEVDAAVAASTAAFAEWSTREIADRAQSIRKLAALFVERSEELAQTITREMGKPIAESREEAEFCGAIFTYYADQAESLMADLVIEETEEQRNVLQTRPVGPLLGIMPWNYPYYQVARFAAPNLMLGNTILLKHAESVPESALAVEKLMAEAGLPEGVYQNIFATHDQVADMIADPRVQGLSLTGSERAGAAVAAQAGQALKKAVLELGGSDPYVVLSCEDSRAAARDALAVRFENTGQACNSNKRIIVHSDIYDEFLAEAVERTAELTPDDPRADRDKTFGPLSSEAAADKLVDQVNRAVEAGGKLWVGGERLDRAGFYVSPAVLTDIPVGSDIYYEEFFGPVVQIFKVDSDEEALELANNTPYGLGSTVLANEVGRAEAFAEGLQAGMVGVNQSAVEREDMPFGGIKRSGYGRELGPVGMNEFVNKRLMSVRKN